MTRAGGFTLIEVLIALTLGALVTTLGAGILRAGVDYFDRARLHLHQQQQLRGALRLVRAETRGAPRQGFRLAGDAATVDLATDTLPAAVARPGRQQVRLSCREGELVHGLRRPGDDPVYDEEIVADRLTRCRFAYLVQDGRTAAWRDAWPDGEKLPLALRLHLATERNELPPVVFALR